MTSYPPLLETIHHTPRPSTLILEKVTANMSTSPSLRPHTGPEPPSSRLPALVSSEPFPVYPQFLLFGDSITQFGTLTLQAYLQTQYIRRLDVVNRGLAGYTAPMGYKALQKFLPCSTSPSMWPEIKLATVFFGANDSCVPGESQHVELQQFVDVLRDIVNYAVFNRQGGLKTNIIVITPPPVNEHQFVRTPTGDFQRRTGVTSQYARAAEQAAKAYGVHVIDLWSIIMQKVGWTPSMGRECCSKHIPYHIKNSPAPSFGTNQHIPGCHHLAERLPDAEYQLSDFLADGLHLTKLGYDVLFCELLKLIKSDLSECAPENLPFVLSDWKDALGSAGT